MAFANRVLPQPGGPRAARRGCVRQDEQTSRGLQKLNLVHFVFGFVDASHVGEGHVDGLLTVGAWIYQSRPHAAGSTPHAHALNKEEPNGRNQDDQWQHASEQAHPDAGACFVVFDVAFVQLLDINAGLADLKEDAGPSVWFAQSAGSRANVGHQPVVFHRNRAFEAALGWGGGQKGE